MLNIFKSSRSKKSGITLVTTLISLILLVGVALTVQSFALRNVSSVKRLGTAQQASLDAVSYNALARPHLIVATLGLTDDEIMGSFKFELDDHIRHITYLVKNGDVTMNYPKDN